VILLYNAVFFVLPQKKRALRAPHHHDLCNQAVCFLLLSCMSCCLAARCDSLRRGWSLQVSLKRAEEDTKVTGELGHLGAETTSNTQLHSTQSIPLQHGWAPPNTVCYPWDQFTAFIMGPELILATPPGCMHNLAVRSLLSGPGPMKAGCIYA
jgi:hypothetical protein